MRSTTPLATSRFVSSPAIRAISRWLFGTVGILWVAMAASLCGCSPISPVNGWGMNQHGKSHFKKGHYAQARQEFERALMDSPQNADYAYNVAAAMDQQGDHPAAEKMYRHALTLDPSHQPAYHGLAEMMQKDGRSSEASDLLTTWEATQPYSPEAATELGWLKGEQGDFDGANRELRKALRQNPRHTRALAQLGRVHRRSGHPQDAAAEYARSLYMDPDQPETQAELASLNGNAYGDPALQMAAAMPLYDPTLQPAGYPAFTASPSPSQMALNRANSPSMVPLTDQDFAQLASPGGMTISPVPMQSKWSQPPNSFRSMQSVTAQPYNTARPANSFFQPQQSFNGSPTGFSVAGTPMSPPMNDATVQAGYNNAPNWSVDPSQPTLVPGDQWTTSPTMNASPGNAPPAAQISSVPVVPAF